MKKNIKRFNSYKHQIKRLTKDNLEIYGRIEKLLEKIRFSENRIDGIEGKLSNYKYFWNHTQEHFNALIELLGLEFFYQNDILKIRKIKSKNKNVQKIRMETRKKESKRP